VSFTTYITKIGSSGSGDDQFETPMGVTILGSYLYVVDRVNHRVVKRALTDLSYSAQFSFSGQANNSYTITNDGTYYYIGSQFGPTNIQKRNLSDGVIVVQLGDFGLGNDLFNVPMPCTTDGTNLYMCDQGNHRIIKRLLSNLSYVTEIGTLGDGDDQFYFPTGMCNDGTHLYIADRGNGRIKKHLMSDLSYVSKIGGSDISDGVDQMYNVNDITHDGTYLYVLTEGNSFDNTMLLKRNISDLSHVDRELESGSGDDQLSSSFGLSVDCDGAHLYISDTGNDRLMKREIIVVSPPDPPVASIQGGIFENTISWASVVGATSYNIYWDTSSPVTVVPPLYLEKITGVTSPYDHTELAGGTTIYYIVTAVGDSESEPSNEVSATPLLPSNTLGRIIW